MRREYPQGLPGALRHAARFSQYEAEILDAVDEIERLREFARAVERRANASEDDWLADLARAVLS
jgi:hypothetical protein